MITGPLQHRWQMQLRKGIKIEGRRLTNLRFADDILLLGHSPEQLQGMLGELMLSASPHGLNINTDKTKALNNGIGRRAGCKFLKVAGNKVEVVSELQYYLGRRLCLSEPHDVEIRSRIQKGKGAFFHYKLALTNANVSVVKRIKLLDSVVTPVVLFGSASWTMTKSREAMLMTAQRELLRRVVGCKRGRDEAQLVEPWVDYVKRSTHIAEMWRNRANVSDWIVAQRRRKWAWAGHCARRDDDRWSHMILLYTPASQRLPGRPCRTWVDTLEELVEEKFGEGVSWLGLAANREAWKELGSAFAEKG